MADDDEASSYALGAATGEVPQGEDPDALALAQSILERWGAIEVAVPEQARGAARLPAVAPPPLVQNLFHAGGKRKLLEDGTPPTTFRCVFEDAQALGTLLATVRAISAWIPLTFTDRGLEVLQMDGANHILVQICVPRAGFLVYEGLVDTKHTVTVPAIQFQTMTKAFTPDTTMTLFRQQTGEESEPLGVQMYPRDGRRESGTVLTYAIKPALAEREVPSPHTESRYQFRILVGVRALTRFLTISQGKHDWVAFSLTADSLDVATALLHETAASQTISLPTIRFPKGVTPSDADVRTALGTTGRCWAARIPGSSTAIKLSSMTNLRVAAKYLVRALAFGVTAADFIDLWIGRQADDAKQDFSPLRLCFLPRAGSPVETNLYIAPRIELD